MQDIIEENRINEIDKIQQPAALRFIAYIVSVIFHPLFIPIYVTCFLLYWHPLIFAGFTPLDKIRLLASVAVNLTLLPAFTVFLLWRLKFADNIYLRTQKERIIPYAATMFFSFWCWNVFRNISYSPPLFVDFLLGTFIAVIVAWMANIYFKISMHSLAVGGIVCFTTIVAFSGEGSSGLYVAAALLLAGIVCTARLIVSDHKPFEIYAGLFLGGLSQWVAHVF